MQRFLNNYGGAHNFSHEGNDSIVSSDFNWDDLSLANDTNAGNSFFGRKHPEHERKDKIQSIDMFFGDAADDIKKNEANVNNQNDDVVVKQNSVESDENLSMSFEEKIQIDQPQQHNQNERKPLAQHNPKVPGVYQRIELTKQRKELMMKAIERQERERRKFHAKPVPNFTAIHAARSNKRLDEPKITIPKTPQVVRSHRHYSEIAQAKQKEMIASLKPKPFVSKEPDVLRQQPYVPRPTKKAPTEPAPFHLQSNERLRERRQYDQKIEMETKRKQKEEEERLKIEDEQIRRQLRQQTEFKANPNPFSVGKVEYHAQSD